MMKVEKIDDFAVRITIERSFAPFAANMAMSAVAIVSPTAAKLGGEAFDRNPVGTGPFKFMHWDHERIVLERNPHYWRGTPPFERVIIRHIGDSAAQLLAGKRGDIDVAFNLTPDQLETLIGFSLATRLEHGAENILIGDNEPPVLTAAPFHHGSNGAFIQTALLHRISGDESLIFLTERRTLGGLAKIGLQCADQALDCTNFRRVGGQSLARYSGDPFQRGDRVPGFRECELRIRIENLVQNCCCFGSGLAAYRFS